MKLSIVCLTGLALLLAFGTAWTAPKKGGGKGGFGDVGNGCIAFASTPAAGTIHDDGGGSYCNGSDGQVSVPKRLRMDTRKFNRNARIYWLDAICHGGQSPSDSSCLGPVSADVFQSQMEYQWVGGTLVPTEELDFQAMTPGESARVSLAVDAGSNRQLRFGNENGVRVNCPADTSGEPVWVSCEGDSNGDGFCDLWTLSTASLDGSGDPSARACLINESAVVDGDVQADFTLNICVLGVSCP